MTKPNYWLPEYGNSADFLMLLSRLKKLPHYMRRKFVLSANRRERFLYKFLDFDSNVSLSIKKARDLIVDSELYLAKPSEFNDPNEFRATLRASSDPVARRRWLEQSAKKTLKNNPGFYPGISGTRRRVERLVSDASHRIISNPDELTQKFETQRNRNGVACFATNARSTLMWSHYGRGHRGICLQFERTFCLGLLAPAQPVEYRERPPEFVWPDEKDRIMEAVLGKSKEWEYEGERRCVSTRIFGASLRFDDDALSGIILGQRFAEYSAADLAVLKGLLEIRKKKGFRLPKLYRATRSPADYGIRFVRVSSLDE